MLLVCQNGSINIVLFVRVALKFSELSITLHYLLSVNALYLNSYTQNYFFPYSTVTYTYCILSTHTIHQTLQFKHVFLKQIILDLCICSQHLCCHDVLTHCNAHRRGWPHDWPKSVDVIQCIYNNFIHLYPFDSFSYQIKLQCFRMRRRVSLLTDLRFTELCCFLRQPCMTS